MMRLRRSRLRSCLAVLIGLWPAAARGAESGPIRVSVLSAGDRASLVLETLEPIARVSHHTVDARTVTVEAGPMSGTVPAQSLTSAPGVPLIESATIRAYTDATGRPLVRVTIRLRAACQTAVRTAGLRIYVDAFPLDATNAPTVAPVPVSDPPVLTYAALEADVLRRAPKLASRPNVKGLIALRAEVMSRDARLGGTQPELVVRLLTEVDKRTEEARALRLKLDSLALTASQSTARTPRD